MDVDRLKKMPRKVIAYFENDKIRLWNYIATFFAAIMIRQLLESLSQADKVFNFSPMITLDNTYHFTLAYLVLVMLLSIFIHYVTAQPVLKICRVLCPGMMFLMVAPLLDLAFTWGHGVNMSYLQPGVDANLWWTYFTVGSGYEGLTLGMRIEVRLILLSFFIYFLTKKYSLPKSVIYAWGCYTLIYIWGMSPYIVTGVLAALGFSGRLTQVLMTQYFLFILFFISLWFAYLVNTSAFHSIARNIRVSKIIYYLLTLVFGASLAIASEAVNLPAFIYINQTAVIGVIFSLMSVFYAVIFSSLIKIISESGNDEYSVAADVNVNALICLALTMLALTLLYASFVNAKIFLMMASVLGIFFIYDALPLQLKRIPVASQFAMSSNSLILILLGYTVVRQVTVAFPLHLIWIYLVGMTFASSSSLFIKLLGKKTAGIVSGVIAFLTCMSFYFVLEDTRLLPILASVGILFFYLCIQTQNNRNKFILLCNSGLLAMSMYLVW